jgi:hypothetical protein
MSNLHVSTFENPNYRKLRFCPFSTAGLEEHLRMKARWIISLRWAYASNKWITSGLPTNRERFRYVDVTPT